MQESMKLQHIINSERFCEIFMYGKRIYDDNRPFYRVLLFYELFFFLQRKLQKIRVDK